MAKAKKPVSKGGTAVDKVDDGVAKAASSMPKTTRSKPSGTSTTAEKRTSPPKADAQSTSASASAPSKATPSEPVKKPDADLAKPSSKPTDAKPVGKPDPVVSKTPESQKVEVKPAPTKPPVPEPEGSGSLFWPLVIGGALAAVLGFLASEMNLLGTRGDTSDLRASLSKQQAQIAELQSAEPQTAEIQFPELDELTGELASVSEAVSEIETRLTEVEKRPVTGGSSAAASAAYARELATLQASVEEQRSEIQGLLDNAQSIEEATADAERNAMLQAALTRIAAAINGGKPFASALADLQANGQDDIPTALTDTADSGVVTLINLQTRFPDAARAALATARADGTEDEAGGFGGFLRRQLGARSVAPREGTDPDAVLSRAEAAVRDGRLTDALAEIDTLPETSQSAMDDWLADARARQAAEAAAEDLSQRLTAN